MSQRIAGLLFMTGVMAAILVYEWVAYSIWGNDGTLTYVVRKLYADFPLLAPMVAVAWGILFRHLFPPPGGGGAPPPPSPTASA